MPRRAAFAVIFIGLSTGIMAAQQQPPAAAVFTASQAAAGRATYSLRCAACHMDDLDGNGDAPRLAGEDFIAAWKQKTTAELLRYMRGMPPGGPALTEAEYVDVIAYVLEQNGAAAGETALTATAALPIGTLATGRRPLR